MSPRPKAKANACDEALPTFADAEAAGPNVLQDHVWQMRQRMWANGLLPVPVYSHDFEIRPTKGEPIELKARGKRPAGQGWQKNARLNPPTATRSLPSKRELNTGLLCDGLRAVDLDIDDEGCLRSVEKLMREHLGPSPTRWRDGSPRIAALYRAANGEAAKLQIVGERGSIEILGTGNQLVVHGRHHTGAELLWEGPDEKGVGLDEIRRDDLAEVSDDEVAAFLKAAAAILAPIKSTSSGLDLGEHTPTREGASHDFAGSGRAYAGSVGPRNRATAEAALRDEVQKLAATGKGGRNNALNDAAFSLGTLVGNGSLSRDEVEVALEEACEVNGVWGEDGARQCRNTIRSGLDAGTAKPRDLLDEEEWGASTNQALSDDDYRASEHLQRPGKGARLANDDQPEDGGGAGEDEGDGTESEEDDGGDDDGAEDAPAGADCTDGPEKGASGIKATPWARQVQTSMPKRTFLYGRHLQRGKVAITVAPGGVGKSALTGAAEALAMATGHKLLHDSVAAPLRVWIWNLEEDQDELNRRIEAACSFYRIEGEVSGLFVDNGFDMPCRIAQAHMDGTRILQPKPQQIIEEIKRRRIDVLVIDPFVSTHFVNENDNAAIDAVAKEWARVANEAGCAVHLVHHTTKLRGDEATVELSRGASALVNAARSARAINPMTKEEANLCRISEVDRWRYFRVNDGKANYAPATGTAQWFAHASVELENGDNVGVVTPFTLPSPTDGVTFAHLQEVRRRAGELDEAGYRESAQSPDWIGHMIADVIGEEAGDPAAKGRITACLRMWIGSGWLKVVDGVDASRKSRKFVVPGDTEPFDSEAFREASFGS